jgi:hypothetical protein
MSPFVLSCRAPLTGRQEKFETAICLAPRTGLELGTFWLTVLVVFSEPDTQAEDASSDPSKLASGAECMV